MTMDQQLQSLLDYRGDKILSVYLNTDLTQRSKEAVRLTFRQRAAELDDVAVQEINSVKNFLDFEYDWQSRGIAVFCSADALWHVVPLPISVPSQLVFSDRPSIRTLVDVGERFGKYNIAVLDRERLRLFSVAWGKIQSETETVGEELKRHKQGGWSAAGYQRHEDNLALHNLKHGVDLIQQFSEHTGNRRLILGGSPEVLSQIKDLMPKSLQDQITGEFVVDVMASPTEILELSLDVFQEIKLAEEQNLVTEAITEASKGGTGVTGLNDTLYALFQGQVWRLLVDENYDVEGFVCTNCGFVLTEQPDLCPLCQNTAFEEAQDVVNIAIRKAAETGSEVNIIRENEELTRAGGIAAITRY